MKQVVFFNQKNKWNLEVKTNFENFDFQVLPVLIFALILIKTHHFQTSNINLYSEFTNWCRFWFKIFQNVLWKNSIFLTSEAPLLVYLQNWTKSLSFHESGLSGQLSFGWASWKSLGLNYSKVHPQFRILYKMFVG